MPQFSVQDQDALISVMKGGYHVPRQINTFRCQQR